VSATPEVGLEPTTLRLRFTPGFRQGADYFINFSQTSKSCRALVGYYWIGSSIPSLCTFLPTLFSQTLRQASLKVAILITTREGFLEFTQFFNHSHLWKLQHSSMKFSVTVSTQQNAFFNLLFHLFPASCISFTGYTKIFFRWVEMMKF
jgi:hypothetical protein